MTHENSLKCEPRSDSTGVLNGGISTQRAGRASTRRRLVAIAVATGLVLVGAGVYFGWHVQIVTHFVVDYQNSTGSWPESSTPYILSVKVCNTFEGWSYGKTGCGIVVTNPMNQSQFVLAWSMAFGWSNSKVDSWPWSATNATVFPNGTIELLPHTGTIQTTLTFSTPESGGQFTNVFFVDLHGSG